MIWYYNKHEPFKIRIDQPAGITGLSNQFSGLVNNSVSSATCKPQLVGL